MEIRILGARQGESRETHFGSLLVDGGLALDAGSLTSTLTLAEQAAIQSILLTHQHLDHIKDLATLGFNAMGRRQIHVYCTPEVKAAVQATVLNPLVWIDFFEGPAPLPPTFIHVPIQPEQPFSVGPYRVRPVPVRHAVPTVGFEVADAAGRRLLYTGDSGPGSGLGWAAAKPDLLITEVTAANADSEQAARHGHLSTRLLVQELLAFRSVRGYLPRVAIVHVNPYSVASVAAELAVVAADLPIDIELAQEQSVYTL